MLIISESQFLNELAEVPSKSISITNDSIIEPKESEIVMENDTYDRFRKPSGIPNIPPEVKSIASVLGSTENYDEVSNALDISKDTIGNLANDNHSNKLVKNAKINVLERLRDHTIEKVSKCVEFLEITKDMPRKELLSTAESLSRVHRNMNGNDKSSESDRKTQFIFYIPEHQASLKDYEVIDSPV